MPIEKEPIVGIRMLNASLDETVVSGEKRIVLRGVIDSDHLGLLKVDNYQRNKLSVTPGDSLWMALKKGDPIPDIELGMRGENFTEIPDSLDVVLRDPTYLIDGLQRVTHVMAFLEKEPRDVRLGATVYFNTTREWELERFRILNTSQKKVSPNVLLRNLREKSQSILTLYGLSNADKEFPLFKRVAWGQNMARGEMVTAMILCSAAIWLHRHICGAPQSRTYDAYAKSLDRTAERISLNKMRTNVKTFYELIDAAWGIKTIEYSANACWLRGEFQKTLALVLSDHTDFWDAETQTVLTISLDLKRKIASFPVFDPSVINLAAAGGRAANMLYGMLLDHINSGKRTNRLTNRAKLADELEAKRVAETNAGDDDAAGAD